MAKYRFFKTNFGGTFEIEVFKVGRRNGFVVTGAMNSFLKNRDKLKEGWYCYGTLREHRKDFPKSREIKQSTARKHMRRCPVRFYESIMQRKEIADKLAELSS